MACEYAAQKVEAVTETLGIIFPGYKVGATRKTRRMEGQRRRKGHAISEGFLTRYDVDYIL